MKRENAAATTVRRIRLLDTLRGAAVLYMLYYHTLFDLGYMFGIEWARRQFDAQPASQMIIGCTFIFVAGLTIRFSRNAALHGARLLLVAFVFSLVTAFFFPGAPISFGVLHLLAVSMLVYGVAGKWLERLPWWLGAVVFLLLYIFTFRVPDGFFGIEGLLELPVPRELTLNNVLYPFGFIGAGYGAADYYPLLPWLFLFLCGCSVGRLLSRERLPEPLYRDFCPPLTFVGRNSLLIYVLHQPIIYGALCLILGFPKL